MVEIGAPALSMEARFLVSKRYVCFSGHRRDEVMRKEEEVREVRADKVFSV